MILYCIYRKKSVYNWTGVVQSHVAQGLLVSVCGCVLVECYFLKRCSLLTSDLQTMEIHIVEQHTT